MKVWLAKVSRAGKSGLIPTDDESRALLNRMAEGECAEVEIVRPRSLSWHRMYFGICSTIGKNQDPPRDVSSIDYEVRILAGHYEVMYVQGHEVFVPKRIAFHKMDGDEWAEYWQRAEMAIRERFGNEYVQEARNAA